MISEFNEDLSGAWDSANRVIRAAAKVSVFTGAGMSEDSGIPTFRGSGGLWKGRRPEHWATPESFLESPEKVREFYNWRRELISGVNPHPGHLALGRWAMSQSQTVDVITQNVDGFHQQSGCPRVLELHGTLWLQHCHQCQQSEKNLDAVHCCCGGRFRPSVVWFGESLPQDVWQQAEEVIGKSDVLLVVGTSAVVYPAAALVFSALDRGCPVVEINPQPVLGDPAICLEGTAAEVLPRLIGSL